MEFVPILVAIFLLVRLVCVLIGQSAPAKGSGYQPRPASGGSAIPRKPPQGGSGTAPPRGGSVAKLPRSRFFDPESGGRLLRPEPAFVRFAGMHED